VVDPELMLINASDIPFHKYILLRQPGPAPSPVTLMILGSLWGMTSSVSLIVCQKSLGALI
jgi:hypothetical protein